MPNQQIDVCTQNFTVNPGDNFTWTNYNYTTECAVTPCDPNNWPLTEGGYRVPGNGTCPATVSSSAQSGNYCFDSSVCTSDPNNPKSITIP